jgi:cytochrome c-type biogenesis protein CcmH/NrfG
MKKSDTVEIKSISLNTALTAAVVCLVVGFLAGVVYSTYKSGAAGTGLPGTAPTGAASAAAPSPRLSPQQAERILSLEKQVSADPNDRAAWLELGNLYFDSGNHQGSIRSYREFLELDPDNPDVWTDLGVMYRRTGEPDQALAAFEQAMAIDPRHQQSRFNKGVVLMQDLGRGEEAVKTWQELVAINPDFRTPSGQRIKDVLEDMKQP